MLGSLGVERNACRSKGREGRTPYGSQAVHQDELIRIAHGNYVPMRCKHRRSLRGWINVDEERGILYVPKRCRIDDNAELFALERANSVYIKCKGRKSSSSPHVSSIQHLTSFAMANSIAVFMIGRSSENAACLLPALDPRFDGTRKPLPCHNKTAFAAHTALLQKLSTSARRRPPQGKNCQSLSAPNRCRILRRAWEATRNAALHQGNPPRFL